MNILFLTENEISPLQGGTERITDTLSTHFQQLGHTVGLAWLYPLRNMPAASFSYMVKWELNDSEAIIEKTIKENHVDVVICNYVRYSTKRKLMPAVYSISHRYGCKVIACLHAMPGEDLIPARWSNIWYRLTHRYDTTQAIKDLALHLMPKWMATQRMRAKYRLPYDNCDRMVLLSDRFVEPYMTLAGIDDRKRFIAIGNSLSFDGIKAVDPAIKQKKVLIISRIHERSKRLSLAVDIWRNIESDSRYNEWELNIIGGGQDLEYLETIVRKAGTKRLHLLGRQPDLDQYYNEAAIFMMTSAFEGFGITLTEAQQYGVVPIAFNSYRSLEDIIDNGRNGIVVPDNNIESYTSSLKQLMNNTEQRCVMSHNAVNDCRRFSSDKIIAQWIDLFEKLCQKSQ